MTAASPQHAGGAGAEGRDGAGRPGREGEVGWPGPSREGERVGWPDDPGLARDAAPVGELFGGSPAA
ncbi:hypothetical protein [Candidatus Blastococcus massiliensis]|uniref:hypothetical protein n=1 Tax=Candidatus Blastococcus massiliensis TaxID=1470358 RepID=UPI0004BA1846|nr:hypothetical protein [Candidatus Blastococcus massiliensis]